jgi:DNA-binding HxlR family transcriptional regulator
VDRTIFQGIFVASAKIGDYTFGRRENAMKILIEECRVRATIDVLRGKWKAVIIKALKDGSLGYGELRRLVPEPSKKVLTDHLRELEKDRIVSRTTSGGKVVRSEYAITEYGRTLIPVLVAMRAWGKTHRELVLGYPKKADDDADPCIPPTNRPNKPPRLKRSA